MDKPYKEENNIRIFKYDVNEDDLIWHRDKEDRRIEILQNDNWKFQYDNELPFIMRDSFIIKKETFHRIIKGKGDLIIKIFYI